MATQVIRQQRQQQQQQQQQQKQKQKQKQQQQPIYFASENRQQRNNHLLVNSKDQIHPIDRDHYSFTTTTTTTTNPTTESFVYKSQLPFPIKAIQRDNAGSSISSSGGNGGSGSTGGTDLCCTKSSNNNSPTGVVPPNHEKKNWSPMKPTTIRHVRSQSTPSLGTDQRRTIFQSFWKKTNNNNDNSCCSLNEGIGGGDNDSLSSSKSSQSRRTSSSSLSQDNSCIMRFAPPKQHKSTLRSRFEDLYKLPDHVQQQLPPLPSPLSRICRNDGCLASKGMYPLTSPKSILKKNKYWTNTTNPTTTTITTTTTSTKTTATTKHSQYGMSNTPPPSPLLLPPPPPPPPPPNNNSSSDSLRTQMIMSIPFSMTDSIHHFSHPSRGDDYLVDQSYQQFVAEEDAASTSSTTSSSTVSSPSAAANANANVRKVHFDPRVTISEYDDHYDRKWYTDAELDRFKFETIALAQRYLLHHPETAAEYCKGTIDPVTGCIRKRTLYSLPILNDVSYEHTGSDNDDDDDQEEKKNTVSGLHNLMGSSSRTCATQCNYYSELTEMHVQRILIVDPNSLILDLFRKSLKHIFPKAEITTVQTGEEALYHAKRAWSQSVASSTSSTASPCSTKARAFDICIVEERLRALSLRCVGRSPRQQQMLGTKTRSLSDMTEYKSAATAPSSFAVGANAEYFMQKYLSGSDVIARLQELEAEFCRPDRCIPEEDDDDEFINSERDCDDDDNDNDAVSDEPSEQICWKSLIIGVCVDQKHDAAKLWQSGCDVVWSKPPPPLGENMRNQLVCLLAKKRGLPLGTA